MWLWRISVILNLFWRDWGMGWLKMDIYSKYVWPAGVSCLLTFFPLPSVWASCSSGLKTGQRNQLPRALTTFSILAGKFPVLFIKKKNNLRPHNQENHLAEMKYYTLSLSSVSLSLSQKETLVMDNRHWAKAIICLRSERVDGIHKWNQSMWPHFFFQD